LKSVGEIGLKALNYLAVPEAAPAEWVAQQNAALDAMYKPVAETILAAVRPVRVLVNAAGVPRTKRPMR
jgi:hypothetical protein